MKISDERIKKFQEIWKKEYGQEISEEKAREYGSNLVNFFKVLLDCEIEEQKRKERLKEEPEGFSISGDGRNCSGCGKTMTDSDNWYSEYGITCAPCFEAAEEGVLPEKVFENDDCYYTMWELKSRFDLRHQTIMAKIRNDELNAVVIEHKDNTKKYLFLLEENEGILPPKPDSKVVELENGSLKIEREDPKFVPFEE